MATGPFSRSGFDPSSFRLTPSTRDASTSSAGNPCLVEIHVVMMVMVMTGKLWRRRARHFDHHGFGGDEEARHRGRALECRTHHLRRVDDALRQEIPVFARLDVVAIGAVCPFRGSWKRRQSRPSPALIAICRAGQVIAFLTISIPAFWSSLSLSLRVLPAPDWHAARRHRRLAGCPPRPRLWSRSSRCGCDPSSP